MQNCFPKRMKMIFNMHIIAEILLFHIFFSILGFVRILIVTKLACEDYILWFSVLF